MSGPSLLGENKWHDDVIRVVVCDDHALLRRRLVVTLEAHGDLDVMAEAADGEHAIALCRELAPDLVVVGMHLDGIGGPRTVAGVREVSPAAHVVMLVAPGDDADAVRALKAGATGFLSRDHIGDAAAVVRSVSAGWAAVPPSVVRRVLDEYDLVAAAAAAAPGATGAGATGAPDPLAPPVLTDAERSVLERLASGVAERGIDAGPGADDDLDPGALAAGVLGGVTSRNLAANAIEKLYRHARAEAVRYAVGERLFARP